jgi:hypothetical protein
MIRLVGATTSEQTTVVGGTPTFPVKLSLINLATSSLSTPVVQNVFRFNPGNYVVSSATRSVTLEAVGRVSLMGLEATLEIVDSEDGVVGSLSWTETTHTHKSTTITFPESAGTYRCRVSCTGSTDPALEYALIGGAAISISWS